jgi:hypothetical protein
MSIASSTEGEMYRQYFKNGYFDKVAKRGLLVHQFLAKAQFYIIK